MTTLKSFVTWLKKITGFKYTKTVTHYESEAAYEARHESK